MFHQSNCIFLLQGLFQRLLIHCQYYRKLERTELKDKVIVDVAANRIRKARDTVDAAANLIRKVRERYWMHELQTMFPHETDNTHIIVATKFSFLPRKQSRANGGKKSKTYFLITFFNHNNF